MEKKEREVRLFVLSTAEDQKATQKAEEWLRKHDVAYIRFDLAEKKPTREEVEKWMHHEDLKEKVLVNHKNTSERHEAEARSDKDLAAYLIAHPENFELPILEVNHEAKYFGFEESKYEKYLLDV